MEKIILDASVVIKWFAEEENSEKALEYLYQIKEGQTLLIVPELFFYELGNTFLFKNATVKDIANTITYLNNLPIKQKSMHSSFRTVFKNAIDYLITFYDAAYVTLMQKENCEFITADKKLYQKINKNFPLAKLL